MVNGSGSSNPNKGSGSQLGQKKLTSKPSIKKSNVGNPRPHSTGTRGSTGKSGYVGTSGK